MVLLSFSIPAHKDVIKKGIKAQTTRIPRKPRKNGAKPYSVGEKVQLYYRSRMADNCKNCIVMDTPICFHTSGRWPEIDVCCAHTNFFGESVITEIQHHYRYWPEIEEGYYALFGDMPEIALEKWAKADGFENLQEAHKWFMKSTGNELWMFEDWDVIKWDRAMIARRFSSQEDTKISELALATMGL